MTTSNLSSRIRALASDPVRRSQTARLRDVINDVEHAINAGVALEHILSELHNDGFTFTMSGFKQALRRIRVTRPPTSPPLAERNTPAATDYAINPAPTPTGTRAFKTRQQLAAENPDLSPQAVRELLAKQYSDNTPGSLAQQLAAQAARKGNAGT
ncbi:hypothetical protein [Paraburkholderia sp. RL17-373-BIF-A]|uniref:hypothetical protein n=1 Tax=Paraburkholderia sp. RL17-373-BIF-A TaxID=3031629 RepID=UPI0038B9CBEA